jgi:general stress protein 26
MEPALIGKIEAQLRSHRIMSVATLRPDGWPQVTMVGYVNEGLRLYFVISRRSQKFANISRDPRISIAIGGDVSRDTPIQGLSMAARAEEVTGYDEIERLNQLVIDRYPEASVFAPSALSIAVMRAAPEIISVIDHSQGRGHSETITVTPEQLRRFGAAT